MQDMIRRSLLLTAAVGVIAVGAHDAKAAEDKPETIVLVHGAFAGSSSWNGVASRLIPEGYRVIAAANPLRGLQFDADYVRGVVASIPGPVVLVGHSYGGEVISMAGLGAPNVKALVYVAGFAPDVGESAASLAARFPGGTLDTALAAPVPLPGGGVDLYIDQKKFHAQFAADVPAEEAMLMAATQRPVTQAGLTDPSGPPAWKTLPAWFIYGSADRNIPATLHAFMAQRAEARQAIEIKGASHVVMISHPREVADLIRRAASSR
jgi:pimeloyl-ACP methyl ester carboxylesterase